MGENLFVNPWVYITETEIKMHIDNRARRKGRYIIRVGMEIIS